MFFTGNGGQAFWSNWGTEAYAFAEELRDLGYTIVQVKWNDNWLESSPGDDAGVAHLGCRPATVIKYVHENWYVPLGIPRLPAGQAGFAITGNSGGASQVCFALSHYGLANIVDVAVPTGGPPHCALAKSCLTNASEQAYWLAPSSLAFIDRGFGFFDGNGPAVRHDAAFVSRWLEESVATGGHDYNYPGTRVHFIIGDSDDGMRTISRDYFDRLKQEGSPFVSFEIAPATPHAVHSTEMGRAAMKAAVLGLFLEILPLRDGHFQFTAPGLTNFNYVTQETTNLRAWSSVQTNRGPLIFSVPQATNCSSRFYRVLYTP